MSLSTRNTPPVQLAEIKTWMAKKTDYYATYFAKKKNFNYASDPTLALLTVDNLNQFSLKLHKKSLSSADKKTLQRALESATHPLAGLADMIAIFNDMRTKKLVDPHGLSTEQNKEYESLTREYAHIKQGLQNKDTAKQAIHDLAKIDTEFTSVLNTILWWQDKPMWLDKDDTWRAIHERIVEDGQQRRIRSTAKQQRLDKLSEIKKQWFEHHAMIYFSTDRLFTLYEDYLCPLETALHDVLQGRQAFLPIVGSFLDDMLNKVEELQRQVIYSMLNRLQCAEYYCDTFPQLNCDDQLHYICDYIDSNCGIIINNPNKPMPPLRGGLNEQTILRLMTTINNYCRAKPRGHHILADFQKLKMKSLNVEWLMDRSNKAIAKIIENNPFVVFIINIFPSLLEKMTSQEKLVAYLLNTDYMDEKEFLPYRLLQYIETLERHCNDLAKTNRNYVTQLENLVDDFKDKYIIGLTDISTRMQLTLRSKFDEIMGNIFSDNLISFDKDINVLADNAENAKKFMQQYLDVRYFAPADVILMVAQKLKSRVANNKEVTASHCEAILKLIKLFYPVKNGQLKELEERIKDLPVQVKNLKGQYGEILHVLTNYLETPLLSDQELETSLYRHQFIASTHQERWPAINIDRETQNTEERKFNLLDAYIKNVAMKIASHSASINLETFDNNNLYSLLLKLEKILNSEKQQGKDFSKQQKMLNALRNDFDKIVFDKLNDIHLLDDYLLSDSYKINLDKLTLLLNKTNLVFTKPLHHDEFIKSIQYVCLASFQQYCRKSIVDGTELDSEYIQSLQNFLRIDVLKIINRDQDFHRWLLAHLEKFGANQVGLSTTIRKLYPIEDTTHKDIVMSYARKRLDFIQREKIITPEDYAFFYYYNPPSTDNIVSKTDSRRSVVKQREGWGASIRSLSRRKEITPKAANDLNLENLLMDTRAHFDNTIRDKLSLDFDTWDKKNDEQTARIIELLGTEEEIIAYRTKRIEELLEIAREASNHSRETVPELDDFFSVTNPYRLFKQRLLPGEVSFRANQTFEQYLNHAIANWKPTPLLEKIIVKCGSTEQLQQFHFHYLEKCVEEKSDFSNAGFADVFPFPDTGRESSQAMKDHYEQFLGLHNIGLLCSKLDAILATLQEVNKDPNLNEISPDQLDEYSKQIDVIKPLLQFYYLYGANEEFKTLFANLDALYKKIHLHYKMHNVLNKHAFMKTLSTNNIELNNLMMTFIKELEEMQNLLSVETLDEYLDFCEQDILLKIKTAINNNITDDYTSLVTLFHLVNRLSSSEHLKLILKTKYAAKGSSNPYWFSLINHLASPHILTLIEQARKHVHFEDETALITIGTRQGCGFVKNISDVARPIAKDMSVRKPTTSRSCFGDFFLCSNWFFTPPKKLIKDKSRRERSGNTMPIVSPIVWTQDFIRLANFAKNLVELQQKIKSLLTIYFIEDKSVGIDTTKITQSRITAFDALLNNPDLITDDQLFKLWDACAHKLEPESLHKEMEIPYLNFLIEFLATIASGAHHRSKLNRNILDLFTQKIIESLPRIASGFQSLFGHSEETRLSYPLTAGTLFPPKLIYYTQLPPVKQLEERTHDILQKTYAFHFQQTIEIFVEGIIGKRLLDMFRNKCAEFSARSTNPITLERTQVEDIMAKFNFTSALETWQLIYTMALYCKATAIADRKEKIAAFESLLTKLKQDSLIHVKLLAPKTTRENQFPSEWKLPTLFEELKTEYEAHFETATISGSKITRPRTPSNPKGRRSRKGSIFRR